MSLSDPLGDMLTRIRNAQRARHFLRGAGLRSSAPNVLDVLKREGFIRGFAAEELRPGVAQLRIELKYNEGEPVIKEITPGLQAGPARLFRGSRNCRGSMPASAFPSCPRRAA